MPNFYLAVNNLIDQGYDAFIINRRTISAKYTKIKDIPLMYKQKGEPHPGYDCFIFKRETYPKFNLGTICIGVNYVGLTLFANLACLSNNFELFTDKHLTFHLGNDMVWKSDEYHDYSIHNKLEFLKIIHEFQKNNLLMGNKYLKDVLKQIDNTSIKSHGFMNKFITRFKIK